MTRAKYGNTVKVHYTGKLGDGTVFDSSLDRDPLQFTLGEGQMIPGFEQAVVGMSLNESKTVTIPMDQAYGPHREEMVTVIERNQIPENMQQLEVGQQLQIQQDDGQTFLVVVTDVSESSATLDANHPLAGKDLTFDLQLVEII
ncbi:MAG TPA: peptidylprolyl isomerase [Candidatus Bathyarchaeia archaeon]|nr:peptidylprolyl isomerase [Candidatus Bathyarchaeia archaeon]